MKSKVILETNIKKEYEVLSFELSEKGRRKWAGFQAIKLGHGDKGIVHRATGLDYKTINRGITEIENGDGLELGRIRTSGGGRKLFLLGSYFCECPYLLLLNFLVVIWGYLFYFHLCKMFH